MANFIEPCTANDIYRQILIGRSMRKISRDVGVAKGTVRRYKKILLREHHDKIVCPCGRPAFHLGWCLAARQEFIAQKPAIIPIQTLSSVRSGADLILLVNGKVPAGLPDQIRGDVCQEIIAAVLAGELLITEIPAQIKAFIRRVRKETVDYMALSIDYPRRDGRSWHDLLAAP